MICPTCAAKGFAPSIIPDRCEFCDGTFGGTPVKEHYGMALKRMKLTDEVKSTRIAEALSHPPDYYTKEEIGYILPWPGTTVTQNELDDAAAASDKPYVTLQDRQVHALFFGDFNTIFARWDRINGWTDLPEKLDRYDPTVG